MDGMNYKAIPCPERGFCMNNGRCLFFPALKLRACHCPEGHEGERCQFSVVDGLESRQGQADLTFPACFLYTTNIIILLLLLAILYLLLRLMFTRRRQAQRTNTDLESFSPNSHSSTEGHRNRRDSGRREMFRNLWRSRKVPDIVVVDSEMNKTQPQSRGWRILRERVPMLAAGSIGNNVVK